MKRFFYILYQVVLALSLPLFLLYLLFRTVTQPMYRRGFTQRCGLYPSGFFEPLQGKKVFWIHAVSVGEVISSGLFMRRLRDAYPDAALVFSTVTPAGMAAAKERIKGVDLFIYFPFDLIWITRLVVKNVSPSLFIFLETEIWPNCLLSLSERNIPAVLVNGRISDGAYRRYRLARSCLSHVLEQVSLFLMQTDRDVEKIVDLGAPACRVARTGNMKYDQALSGAGGQDAGKLRAGLGLREADILVIAGSTHEGEEEAILEACEILTAFLSPLVVLIAPRHLNRLEDVASRVTKKGYSSYRKSEGTLWKGSRPAILLLDTMGELDRLYLISDLIFIGGSLVPRGGHNVLEAAVFGKPVFFGPFMDNFREIADQLKKGGGGIEVTDGTDMGRKMIALFQHPEESRKRGEAAYQVVVDNRGAVERNFERVAKWV